MQQGEPKKLDPVTVAIQAQRARVDALRAELDAAVQRGASLDELWRLKRRLEREEYFGD